MSTRSRARRPGTVVVRRHERSEVVQAVVGSAAIVVATGLLVFLMRPGGFFDEQPRIAWFGFLVLVAVLGYVAWVTRSRDRLARKVAARRTPAIVVGLVLIAAAAVLLGLTWPGGLVRDNPDTTVPTLPTDLTVPDAGTVPDPAAPPPAETTAPPPADTTAPGADRSGGGRPVTAAPGPAAVRAEFATRLGFGLDDFQEQALDALDAGRSVLVAAPTGAGKTVVAEYAVALARQRGGKVFYTTPLKALSNQKYGDFVRSLGADAVGLLTGDNAINGDAPVVVMTTEVLRNMIYAGSPTLRGLAYVVLDEVHYLQNRYRGAVWEEVIIHLPPEVDLVCLSATVSNAEEVAEWIETVRGGTTAIIEERRPVELVHGYLVGERGSERLHLLDTFVPAPDGELRPNPEAARLDARGARHPRRGRTGVKLFAPARVEVVERLAQEQLLPAITFVFSRAGCDQAVEQCLAAGVRLTTGDERREIRAIAERHTRNLSDDELDVLGYGPWLAGLEAGLAAHHAGMVPPMKEAVEEAFAAGLVKMVYATETLSLGINMPARSVVIEKLSKFTGERHEFLTAGEYTQLAGRAGRRGIDDVGYVLVCWNPYVSFEQVASLASRRTYALRSSFRPTYNMAANLVRRTSRPEAQRLLNLSFAQFHADRDVVGLERQLERQRAQLARVRESAGDADELHGYRQLLAEYEQARRDAGTGVDDAFDRLKPGDVVIVPKRGGRLAVLKLHHGRGDRALAIATDRSLVRLGSRDFAQPPRPVAAIELPKPFSPRSPSFRREAAERLRRVRLEASGDGRGRRTRAAEPAAERLRRLEAEIERHPLTGAPGVQARLRGAATAERIEAELARLERRIAGRGDSLARQFERVLSVLESWRYVEGWELTEAGRLLARLYTETDLQLAEALREGLLDGLSVPETAAVVSCFAYERRGPEGDVPLPPPRWPTSKVAKAARAADRIWRDLAATESDLGLPESRRPDPGFVVSIHDWAAGEELSDVLDDELTGGDFVRHVKQCIDLLRQVALVAPEPATAEAAGQAADACFRGVVAASSIVT